MTRLRSIAGLSGLALAVALGQTPPAAGDLAPGPPGAIESQQPPDAAQSQQSPDATESQQPPDADSQQPPDAESHAAGVSADDLLLELDEDAGEDDPLEPSNRMVFGANEAVYQHLFDPLADLYGFLVPKPVRGSVLRFFDNLGEPAVFLNEVMQLNPLRAGRTTARFAINTTVGVVGLFDPARRIGLPRDHTDFGETLGVYGIGDGWYLVVPLIGPSNVRDLVGDVVNGFLHPQNYFLAYAPQAILATGSGFSRYEAAREELGALRDSSVDFYSAMRSAYLMHRAADIREARASSPVLGRVSGDVASAPR
jgi:phospholipid-binding lipoprotein MlaA